MEQFLTNMVQDICIYSAIYGPDLNKHGSGYMYIYSPIYGTVHNKHGQGYLNIYIFIS